MRLDSIPAVKMNSKWVAIIIIITISYRLQFKEKMWISVKLFTCTVKKVGVAIAGVILLTEDQYMLRDNSDHQIQTLKMFLIFQMIQWLFRLASRSFSYCNSDKSQCFVTSLMGSTRRRENNLVVKNHLRDNLVGSGKWPRENSRNVFRKVRVVWPNWWGKRPSKACRMEV